MFDLAEDRLGAVCGLLNNAGLLHLATPFRDIPLSIPEQTFATNATGSFLAARRAVRRHASSDAQHLDTQITNGGNHRVRRTKIGDDAGDL